MVFLGEFDMRYTLFLIFISLTAFAQPKWIKDTKRHVRGGDIIHWGTGSDLNSPEIALFKARHMAIQTILEECGGFAHKEIVPEKRYVEKRGTFHVAWAKVYISLNACRYSRKNPSKKMENKEIVKGQRFYNKLIGNATSQERENIQKWVLKEQDKIWSNVKAEHDSTQEQISALKEELKILKANIKLQKRPEVPLRVPAQNSMKESCWQEYNMMMAQARMDAAPYGANLAHPASRQAFNRAQMKGTICQRMK